MEGGGGGWSGREDKGVEVIALEYIGINCKKQGGVGR